MNQIEDGTNFYVAQSDQMEPGTFAVVDESIPETKYMGDSSIADSWIGWGIMKALVAVGEIPWLLISEKDGAVLPKGTDLYK